MPDDVPYCSVKALQRYAIGLDLSSFSPDELNEALLLGADLCDAYCNVQTYRFQTVTNEGHDYYGNSTQQYSIYPYNQPIRTLPRFSIATSLSGGGDYVTADVPVVPVQSGQSGLPQVFGNVYLDRVRNFVQPVFVLLKFGLYAAYPNLALDPPQVILSYTSGYDDGTVQVDGYSLPAPRWLSSANRIFAYLLLSEGILSKNTPGIAAVQRLQFGRTSIERTAAGSGMQSEMTQHALKLLQTNGQDIAFGGG